MRQSAWKALVSVIVLAASVPAAHAGTASNSFNVSITLTSQCEATNSGTQTVAFGTYSAFQQSAQTAGAVNLSFRCTRGFSPASMAFDNVDANSTTAGVGVIQGLQYTLTAATPVTTPGTAASSTSIGSGDTVSYAISGSMPADQAGNCATASCTPAAQVRTLVVTF